MSFRTRRTPLAALGLAMALGLSLPAPARSAGEPAQPAPASGGPETAGAPRPPPCTPDSLGGPLALPIPFPPPLEALRRQFLDGKCALVRGEPARAESIFRQGLEQDKRLPDLWRLYLLRAQVEQGQSVQALATLAQVMDGRRPALQSRVRQWLTDGTGQVAGSEAEFDGLATYLVHVSPGVEDYDLLERLLQLAQVRQDDALLRRLPDLLWRMPKDESSARKWAAAPVGTLRKTAAEWLAREQRLTDLRLTRLLAAELDAAKLPTLEPEQALRLGRLYFAALLRDRNYRQAAAQIQSEAVRRRYGFDRREYLTTAIRIELRRQVIAPVLKWLEQLEALTPESDALPGIYLDLARYYEQRRERKALSAWCGRIVRGHPQSWAAPAAFWMLVWNAYTAGNFGQAVTWSTQAIEAGEAFAPDVLARLHYWKARSQERLADAAGAAKTRAILAERWPSTYYGLILERGAVESPAPAKYSDAEIPAGATTPPELNRVWSVPGLADALFIRAVGEEEVADALLRQALQQPLPEDVVVELARLFHYVQAHHLQQRLIANQTAGEHLRRPVADSPFWRQAYPPAYWDLVKDEAGAQEVSPYFVLAVMREESRFQIKADSRSGAKGLMQLMPSTARELARRENANLSDDSLLSPELNIPLGVRYLRRVLHRFDWNPIYAAAAYNAGPGAVTKWTRERGQLPLDEFVESIPYEETQNYVRRVYASYLIYRKLYP